MIAFVAILSMALAAITAIHYYIVKVADKCRCTTNLSGKTVIVTGANTGIGKYTALGLAKLGARLILACRSEEKGKAIVDEIKRTTGNQSVMFMKLDLASLQSVRCFSQEFCNQEERLDILVNNAGLYGANSLTDDGFDLVYGVNYLGHFLLTNLLLEKLRATPASRIVNVSSDMYMIAGGLDLDSLNENLGRNTQYGKSKLSLILFTHQLAKVLSGTSVSAFSLHPGCIQTDIKRNWPRFVQIVEPVLSFFFFKKTEDGAHTSIHCAVAPGLEKHNGGYFKGCRPRKLMSCACDDTMAASLWEKSEELVGLRDSPDKYINNNNNNNNNKTNMVVSVV